MGAVTEIADPADPRVADYLCLTDVALRSRAEPAGGLFIGEGEWVIRRAVRAGYRLRSLLLERRFLGGLADLAAGDVPVYLAEPGVLQAVTGFHVHRGALASLARRPLPEVAELLAGAERLAVLE